MKINRSPWVHQLDKERRLVTLAQDVDIDVAIVGAGIAGISTAFFLLKYTDKSIVVLDKHKLAHGATGHNAGQVVSYFERPFYEIAEEFGIVLAAEGQRSIESSWDLLDQIYTEAQLSIPFSRFIGHDGFSTLEQVVEHLKNSFFRKKAGITVQETWIAKEAPFLSSIPQEYGGLYSVVPQADILSRLETEDAGFWALSAYQKGTLNSALFCQEVALFLQKAYPQRFSLYENTTIHKVVLKDTSVLLDANTHSVKASRAVLCTNGFENVNIINASGLDIDTRFHHDLSGIVARMSGYLETYNKPPTAISYYVPPVAGFDDMEDPYYYLTRRAYEYEKGTHHNLICVGGPQHSIADREEYLYEYDYPEEVQKELDDFVRKSYDIDPNKKIDYKFTWHGLMGYTRNRIRLIGEEPKNKALLYNLGCNGVGILPSIFGGRRIASIIAGDVIQPSIFDPKEK